MIYVKNKITNKYDHVPAIVGRRGKSAYDAAVEGGYVGTEIEWIEYLKGRDGVDAPPGVIISNQKPTDPNNKVWINPDETPENDIVNIVNIAVDEKIANVNGNLTELAITSYESRNILKIEEGTYLGNNVSIIVNGSDLIMDCATTGNATSTTIAIASKLLPIGDYTFSIFGNESILTNIGKVSVIATGEVESFLNLRDKPEYPKLLSFTVTSEKIYTIKFTFFINNTGSATLKLMLEKGVVSSTTFEDYKLTYYPRATKEKLDELSNEIHNISTTPGADGLPGADGTPGVDAAQLMLLDYSATDLSAAEMVPNVYNLGVRGGVTAITLNDTLDGLNLWHFFITAGTSLSVTFSTLSGAAVTIKQQPTSYTAGTVYEISILNNVVIIG